MSEQQDEDAKLKLGITKALAVREAFFEVMKEQQSEIIRRARAKLAAQGLQVSDADVEADL